MPTWLGDGVMATPALRALRERFPAAQITALLRKANAPLFEGLPSLDRIMTYQDERGEAGEGGAKSGRARLIGRLRSRGFDLAVLLPNSFRWAWIASRSRIPRRVGYARDGRGWLLTDRLLPLKRRDGRFAVVPALDYYLGLASYLGADTGDRRMALTTTPQADAAADRLLRRGGFNPDRARPLVLIGPGANFGESKMWPTDRFAAAADRCVRELGATVALTGSPREQPMLEAVQAAAHNRLIDLPQLGMDLRLLKSIVKRASLLITNDTGPRHIAAALGTPVVTIFGPTDPGWTTLPHAPERHVRADVSCSPCQQKHCPLTGTRNEHICMRRVTPPMVVAAAGRLLGEHQPRTAARSPEARRNPQQTSM